MAKAITATGIMNIIRINPLPKWWMLALATLLITFAAPSLTARLIELPGNDAREKMIKGASLSPEELTEIYETRRRTAEWYPLSASLNDLAMVLIEKARTAGAEDAVKLLAEAEYWQRKALALSPADPFGWFRLAYLIYRAEGPSARVAEAWRQSMINGPFEPRLIQARLEMGLQLGKLVPQEAESYVPRLIREMADEDMQALADLAKRGHYISIVESALMTAPAFLADFRSKIQ